MRLLGPGLAMLLVLGGPTAADALVVDDLPPCEAAKRSAAARSLAAMLRCHSRAARLGVAPLPSCTTTVTERLRAAFAHAEDGATCTAAGDVPVVEERLDELTQELVASLYPQPLGASACAAVKLRATGRRFAGDLRCGLGGSDALAPCLARRARAFTEAFTRAEQRGTCPTTGDAATIGVMVDVRVVQLYVLLANGPTTTTTTSTTTSTSTMPPPSDAPSALHATIAAGVVQLTWVNPDPASGNTEVKLLRRLNTPPTDSADPAASVVYSGTATAANDPVSGLLPTTTASPRNYHYAVFGCMPGGTCESTGSRTTRTPSLVQVLRAGGYVLYFRHATASVCLDNTSLGYASVTTSPNWWKSCDANCGTATARQLSPEAVIEAPTVGDFLRGQQVPFGRVVSSEFCRCFTTAELMNLGPTIEHSPLVTFFVYDDVADRCTNSQALIATVPTAGTNTAILTHVGITCGDLGTLQPAEALVYKPDGAGGTLLITRVKWNEWPAQP